MKNLVFNLRTAKAQAEGCAKVSRMAKVLTTLTLLLTLGVGQMWADITFYYMADMPNNWYTPQNSVTMTQSPTNTNRYYSEVELTSGKTYGFCIHEGSNVYKNHVPASTNEKHQ